MSAPVRIEARAWSDIRFATLARLLGLADSDHALIKVARLWSWQTEHFTADQPTYVLDVDTIESVLGAGGPAALVRARLATEVTGGYRLHGTEGQIEWCEDLSSTRQQAGRARAAGARRDARGRLLPRDSGDADYKSPAPGPAQVQRPSSGSPAPSSAPDPSPSPEDQNSPSAHAIPQSVPQSAPAPVPAVSPPAPAREDIAGTQAISGDQLEASIARNYPDIPVTWTGRDTKPSNPSVETTLRANPPPVPIADRPEPTIDQLWAELEAARARAAAARGVVIQLLVAHDPGRRDLSEALADAARVGARPGLVAQVRHAIAVAEGEASVPPDKGKPDQLQWFTGAIFSPRNFRRLVAAPAPKKRAEPRPPRPHVERPPAAPELTSEERAELDAMRERLVANPDAAVAAELGSGRIPAHMSTAELVKRFGDGQRAPPASAFPDDTPSDNPRRKASK